MNKFYYGVAYYHEYMPYERLQKDIELMKNAGINLVRIAESTWSTYEPQEGQFDFSQVTLVLDAMFEAGINVIIGTPTYAVPSWLVKKYPEIMVTTNLGKSKYGARQLMDITHPAYLRYSKRIIEKLVKITTNHPAVIGYQIDNETKHYGTSSENVQKAFVQYLKSKFNNDLDQMNKVFGLDYWSNRIGSWEDFPSTQGTINGSIGGEFSKFQRKLVTDFLTWQSDLVRVYKHENQFITHNFDFEWRGYSYGVQPDVNHFDVARVLDVVGVDIYHPSQDFLSGEEIAFCGSLARTLKDDNYFVLETQAQGFKNWTPYPNQLKLQAYSHISSGASMIEYWNWHSIHNSAETYWKGVLSHDLQPNPIYSEIKKIGSELARIGCRFTKMKKRNKVAIVVSNESLTAIDNWFPISQNIENSEEPELTYNDIIRHYFNELYRMNVEVDILSIEDKRIFDYQVIVVPALYSAKDEELERLNEFVEKGGHALFSFKSGFSDEALKVRSITQPGIIEKSCGISYQLMTYPENVSLTCEQICLTRRELKISHWMELLTPNDAEVIAHYEHPYWGKYAAVTRNKFGKGTATYVGCMTSSAFTKEILRQVLELSGIKMSNYEYPIVVKKGYGENGEQIRFYLNYSNEERRISLLPREEKIVDGNSENILNPWGVIITSTRN